MLTGLPHFHVHHSDTSPSQPAGTGNASIRRTMPAKNRRVKRLSAITSETLSVNIGDSFSGRISADLD
jgi:hypothetical protein